MKINNNHKSENASLRNYFGNIELSINHIHYQLPLSLLLPFANP